MAPFFAVISPLRTMLVPKTAAPSNCDRVASGFTTSPASTTVSTRGMVISPLSSTLTYIATIVEVSVDDSGEITIPRVDTVVDAGLVVNPEATRSQFEGAAVFGTSIVRSGEITAKNGAVEQSNFDSYPVARINEAPRQTNVYIVDSDAPPAGVGEPGVPPFAPALCNAIFVATGTRVRELPLSRTKLGKA